MATYVDLVQQAIDATEFLSASRVQWFGTPAVPEFPARLKRVCTPAAVREYVLLTLQEHLYRNFYCKGGASPWSSEGELRSSFRSVTPLIRQLSEANSGNGSLTPGWK